MEKQLWFHIYSDYRTGTEVDVYTDEAPDDALEINFTLPTFYGLFFLYPQV